MSFGSFEQGEDSMPLAEINMVPLIDVMLVLLIIFMVTAPLMMHAVKVDLPQAASKVNPVKPEQVQLAIDAQGQVHWNGKPLSAEGLNEQLRNAAQKQPAIELHIHADRTVPYEQVAKVMSQAARAGVTRLGFVTEPIP